jgi:RNA polymerase sigma-70 factor (ECF subfamily)
MVKAWNSYDRFEGRRRCAHGSIASPTTCASTCCAAPQRRARPMELGRRRASSDAVLGDPRPEVTMGASPSPTSASSTSPPIRPSLAVARESVRLGVRCRAAAPTASPRAGAHPLRVLRWSAQDAAELLDTSVASVNSALQARAPRWPALEDESLDSTLDPEHEAAARAVRRCVRALRHGRARGVAARGRRPLDAAVRALAPRRRQPRRLVHGSGHRDAPAAR